MAMQQQRQGRAAARGAGVLSPFPRAEDVATERWDWESRWSPSFRLCVVANAVRLAAAGVHPRPQTPNQRLY